MQLCVSVKGNALNHENSGGRWPCERVALAEKGLAFVPQAIPCTEPHHEPVLHHLIKLWPKLCTRSAHGKALKMSPI
jgi:hypothetical protein